MQPGRVRIAQTDRCVAVMELDRIWYGNHPLSILLAPLGWMFCGLVMLRRFAYGLGLARSYGLSVPVIVVGNLTVGGTGKTPLVIWLVEYLRSQGFKPAVVARGYGGKARFWPQQVRPDSDPAVVGDEAVLVAQRARCEVAVGPDRVKAAVGLVEQSGCNVLISDDGLQHLRLRRDVEIVVVDGDRRFGNRRCLPVGPLREPTSRLKRVDMVVCNGTSGLRGEFGMRLVPAGAVNMSNNETREIRLFRGTTVHAVAGIGFGDRFFGMLRGLGLRIVEHKFPDHHPFTAKDVVFNDDFPVLMTEKDAVKCRRYADIRHWCVPVSAQLPDPFPHRLSRLLAKLNT